MINNAVICLGANTPDAAASIAAAFDTLAEWGRVAASSGPYRTAPEYARETVPYLNQVLSFDTALDHDSLHRLTKDYEHAVRSANDHPGLVNLDIDIVVWNGRVMRPKDASAAYFIEGAAAINLQPYTQGFAVKR